jgi:hypothetical protein
MLEHHVGVLIQGDSLNRPQDIARLPLGDEFVEWDTS